MDNDLLTEIKNDEEESNFNKHLCKHCETPIIYIEEKGYYKCPKCGACYALATQNPNDKQIVGNEKNKQIKFFSFYKYLPLICLILEVAICFILGIVFGCEQDTPEKGLLWCFSFYLGRDHWRIDRIYMLKNFLSYRLLHIYYLQKLTGEAECILKDDECEEKE